MFIDGISFNKGEEFKKILINEYGEADANSIIDSSFCNINLDLFFIHL